MKKADRERAERQAIERAEREAERRLKAEEALKDIMERHPTDPDHAHRMSIGLGDGVTVNIDCPGEQHCSLWIGTCGIEEIFSEIGIEMLEYGVGPEFHPSVMPFPIGVEHPPWHDPEEFPELSWWPLNVRTVQNADEVRAGALRLTALAVEANGLMGVPSAEKDPKLHLHFLYAVGQHWLTLNGNPMPGGTLEVRKIHDEAYRVMYNALRDNWEGEATPDEVVDWMFTALRGLQSWVQPLTDEKRVQAATMAAAVFADLSPDPVDYGALTSNVLSVVK